MRSDLPIISPPEPFERRTEVEKYGALYRLGLIGLVVVIGLVTWFAVGLWSTRHVWRDVFVLHDRTRTEVERLNAAYRLSVNPEVTPRQAWDIALRKDVPTAGRYLLAESLNERIAADDPRAYSVAVAYSKDWPGWLRMLMVRPLVEASAEGFALPVEPLEALRRDPDPYVALWATGAVASRPTGPQRGSALQWLARRAVGGTELSPLAAMMLEIAESRGEDRRENRIEVIDRATAWTRAHHPEARKAFAEWEIRAGGVVARGRR